MWILGSPAPRYHVFPFEKRAPEDCSLTNRHHQYSVWCFDPHSFIALYNHLLRINISDIVHLYQGNGEKGWFPDLKRKLNIFKFFEGFNPKMKGESPGRKDSLECLRRCQLKWIRDRNVTLFFTSTFEMSCLVKFFVNDKRKRSPMWVTMVLLR